MTVPSTLTRSGPYEADGSQTTWEYTFKILDVEDLQVIVTDLDGVESTVTTGYSVTNVGEIGGGDVIFSTALADGFKVTFLLDPVVEQEQKYRDQGKYDPSRVEYGFDRIVTILQSFQEKFTRAVFVSVSSGLSPEDYLQAIIDAKDEALAAVDGLFAYVDAAEAAAAQASEYAIDADIAAQANVVRFGFSNSTSVANPGAGLVALNNAAPNLASVLSANVVTDNYGAPNLYGQIVQWGQSTSTNKGQLKLISKINPANFVIYNITGLVDHTTWVEVAVNPIAYNGSFTLAEKLSVSFTRTGDAGTANATVITSSSATAFTVGQNGLTGPAWNVDASTASSVNGWQAKSSATGQESILETIGETNVHGRVRCKGSGNLLLTSTNYVAIQAGTSVACTGTTAQISHQSRAFTNNAAFVHNGFAGTSLSAGVETPSAVFDYSQTNQHQTGAITTQRDVRFHPSTHSAVAASVITNGIGVWIGGACRAGANATITNAIGLYVDTINVANGGSVATSFAAVFAAMTGATTNHGTSVLGGKALFAACATGYASINLAPGTAPTIPVDGDMWMTSAGLFARVNGVTKKLSDSTDCFCGDIPVATNRDYEICIYTPWAGTFTRFATKSQSGTATLALKDAAGTVATNSVSSTLSNNTTITNASFAAGERIYMTLSANAAAVGIGYSAEFTRT